METYCEEKCLNYLDRFISGFYYEPACMEGISAGMGKGLAETDNQPVGMGEALAETDNQPAEVGDVLTERDSLSAETHQTLYEPDSNLSFLEVFSGLPEENLT